jgi:hypothetical protein
LRGLRRFVRPRGRRFDPPMRPLEPPALVSRPQRTGRACLRETGWNPHVRPQLEYLLDAGAGRGLPVALDFDNTLVAGDIGEATLAVLARSGTLAIENIPPHIAPDFQMPDGKRVRLRDCADVTVYYEALVKALPARKGDPAPLANGYAWAVEVMGGLPLHKVLEATRTAYEWQGGHIAPDASRADRTGYRVPRFYGEMVELVAELLRLDYDIWIVSASNVWSVRWMVLNALNPLLRARGCKRGLRADHVRGMACLLHDASGQFEKDVVLVREDKAYAALEERALKRFVLTSRFEFPLPMYSGKVAALWDAVGAAPYLAVGDSPGDRAMLEWSRHRLWIARAEQRGPLAGFANGTVGKKSTKNSTLSQAACATEGRFLPAPF